MPEEPVEGEEGGEFAFEERRAELVLVLLVVFVRSLPTEPEGRRAGSWTGFAFWKRARRSCQFDVGEDMV